MQNVAFLFCPILITSCLRRKDTRLSTRYIFAFWESLGTRLDIITCKCKQCVPGALSSPPLRLGTRLTMQHDYQAYHTYITITKPCCAYVMITKHHFTALGNNGYWRTTVILPILHVNCTCTYLTDCQPQCIETLEQANCRMKVVCRTLASMS